MDKLNKLIQQLEINIPKQELINQTISKASVGWHIEHSLLTINVVIEALKNSNPIDYKWTLSFTKILIFTINKIPRGRAQSPRSVLPTNNYNTETLKNHATIIKEKLTDLSHLDPNNYFEHPFFGKLNVKPTIRFLAIHTKHHIAIINDIVNTKNLKEV